MLTIALTGGIGSGKTAVTDLFQQLATKPDFEHSLQIIDADMIARELLAGSLTNGKVRTKALFEVHQLFGADVFDTDGYLNRSQLRSLIFSSPPQKKQLEALLHPMVYEQIFSLLSQNTPDIAIIAIPLLFETQAEHKFDRILVIDVPVDIQIERSSKRDSCSPDLIKKIISSQANRQVRLDQADDIIDNSGTFLELQAKVNSLLQYYQSLL